MDGRDGESHTLRCWPSGRRDRSHRSAGLVVVGVAGSALGARRSSFASVAALASSRLGAAEELVVMALMALPLGEMIREIGEAFCCCVWGLVMGFGS